MTGDMMRVSRTRFPVTALGPGVRLGIWVQGCPLACAGCMSQDTWDSGGGELVAVDDLLDLWREALDAGADGVTVSGGEPLAQAAALTALLGGVDALSRRTAADASAGPDILVFTGYELDELDPVQATAIARADAVMTGRYQAGRPTDLIWRGSANQRLHLLSERARLRYARYVDLEVEQPDLQMGVDPNGFWIVGVPRAGTLPLIERALNRSGLTTEQVSWRPHRTTNTEGPTGRTRPPGPCG